MYNGAISFKERLLIKEVWFISGIKNMGAFDMVFCGNCGNEVPDGSQFCSNCGAAIENRKEEIKQFYNSDNVIGETDDIKEELEYASIGTRFVAIFIDGLIITPIIFLLALFSIVTIANKDAPIILICIVIISVYIVYFTILEGPFNNGQTIGKRVMSIRVVNEANESTTYTKSLIRNILRFVDQIPFFPHYLVGFIAIYLSDKNQRIGDMAAKTIVIKEGGNKEGPGITSDDISKKLEERRKGRMQYW